MNLPFLYFVCGAILEVVSFLVYFKNNIQSPSPLFFVSFLLHIAAVAVFSYGVYRGSIRHHMSSPKTG